jgi:DNA-binding LacI/PurR family transcriptional regulator
MTLSVNAAKGGFRDLMPATQRDVAKEAGVSVSTVSRVIRNERYISETTRHKVLDAIQKLQYRPDLVARRLKYGRTYAFALVTPSKAQSSSSAILEITNSSLFYPIPAGKPIGK